MNAISGWKLTYDPAGAALVLADFTDELAAVPSFPLSRGVDVIDILDTDAPFLRPTGGHAVQFGFQVFRDPSSDAAARILIMESLLRWQGRSKKPLKVEALGVEDRYWQYAVSHVGNHTPAMVTDYGAPRVSLAYTVVAVSLSQVGP